MKGEPGKLPTIALLEVCGGKWKLDTMAQIAAWLQKELPDVPVIA